MKLDPAARLVWPVYPHNPYSNGPETDIERAVGALSVPLRLKAQPGRYIRTGEQEIVFTIASELKEEMQSANEEEKSAARPLETRKRGARYWRVDNRMPFCLFAVRYNLNFV